MSFSTVPQDIKDSQKALNTRLQISCEDYDGVKTRSILWIDSTETRSKSLANSCLFTKKDLDHWHVYYTYSRFQGAFLHDHWGHPDFPARLLL